MITHSLILAAGGGKRLLPLTQNLPKALVTVNSNPLISYSLSQLYNKVRNISVTVGYHSPKLIDYCNRYNIKNFINTENKGNSWWLFNSEYKYLDTPLLVIPCDIITILDLDFMYSAYLAADEPACLLIPVSHPNDSIQGDFIHGSNGLVSKLDKNPTSSLFCSGIQIINPKKLNSKVTPNEDFNLVWNDLIEVENLKFSKLYPHVWYTINNINELNSYEKNYK